MMTTTTEMITNISFFLAVPRGIWDLSSQTRDGTHAPCAGSAKSTTGLPGKSH